MVMKREHGGFITPIHSDSHQNPWDHVVGRKETDIVAGLGRFQINITNLKEIFEKLCLFIL